MPGVFSTLIILLLLVIILLLCALIGLFFLVILVGIYIACKAVVINEADLTTKM